jgi:rubrerythrin
MTTITTTFIKENLLTADGKLSSQKMRDNRITLSIESLYLIYHNMDAPAACSNCGKSSNFKNFTTGYRAYCSAKCSANSRSTNSKRKETNLIRYGFESAISAPAVQEKVKRTNLAKFGVAHPMMLAATQEKRKATFIERYGCEFPMQSSACIDNIKQTNLEKYGTEWANQNTIIHEHAVENRRQNWFPDKMKKLNSVVTPLFDINSYYGIDTYHKWQCSVCSTQFDSNLSDGRIPRCPTCYPYGYNTSKPEKEIIAYIESLGVKVESGNRSIIRPFELDAVVHEKKLAIEINGEYWHSDLQGRGGNYHLNKTQKCNDAGYRLIQILLSEWADRPELVKSRLSTALGKNQRIYARNCKLVIVDSKIAMRFLEDNHMQGTCPASVRLGLEYNGELVALMTFGKARYNKKIEWELLRFVTKKYTCVAGGASKLLSSFIKQYDPLSIVSYCDLRWNTGTLYTSIGFNLSHSSPPNYWYTRDYHTLESRVCYQKHKLATSLVKYDPVLTEWKNMQANGYDRIWDCGNSVYVWNKTST